jgi:CheY-like chemotaxis protein
VTAAAEDPSGDGLRAAAPKETDFAGIRMLFVDDDRDTRIAIARMLGAWKADVETASSASEALERLASGHPHVLISDLGMPVKDGYELIREVRRSPEHRALPAVALSAYARAEDRKRALDSGYDVHVVKPVEPRDLRSVLAALLHAGETP